jgi:hypothetical protein
MIFWMSSYFTSRTQRVRVGNYWSETIYCHSGLPQGSHLGPLFFIADINDVLDIFEILRFSLMPMTCGIVRAVTSSRGSFDED